jgi:hypothetical protein
MPETKPSNPLLDVLLTVVIPSFVLDWASKPERLGPFWALVVASAVPLLFGIYCWWTKSGINLFSIIGLVAVVLTGCLGLLKLDAFWVGVKEASFPVIMGILFPLSHGWKQPLVKALLMQPQILNLKALNDALQTPQQHSAMDGLLRRCAWLLCATLMCSAVLNQVMAMRIVGGTEPGSVEYNQALAKLNWVSMLGIGLPMMVAMVCLMLWFFRSLSRITGLDHSDLTNPGQTVRRSVGQ